VALDAPGACAHGSTGFRRHVRNDIGVPYFLTAAERARTVTIGLLESDDIDAGTIAMHFDVFMLTPAQPRADPCDALRKRLPREAPSS
jgi:hypothetical protein